MVQADTLKAMGTQKYKQGDLKEAISLYKQAAELEPSNPVHLSNLWPIQAASETCAEVLNMVSSDDTSFRPKISARLAKSLSFSLHHEGHSAEPEFCDPARVKALQRQIVAKRAMQENLINKRLSSLPRYRASPEQTLEYYVVGHDPVNSILRSQHTGQDSRASDVLARHVRLPRKGPFDFSAFFCGIGDARHMYGSLLDLGQDCPNRPPTPLKIHFTAVDIHPTALARDLIVLFSLKELATFKDPESSKRAKHLLVMLHYVFWASLMPPLAGRILDEMVERVSDQVSAAVANDKPLDIGWLYIEPHSCKQILQSLKWWRTDGKTAVTYEKMIPILEDAYLSRISSAERAKIMEDRKLMKLQFIQSMKSPENAKHTKRRAAEAGQSVAQFIQEWESMSDDEFNKRNHMNATVPKAAFKEKLVYPDLHVLIPPDGIEEPKTLEEKVFRPIRNNKAIPPPEEARQIHEKWIANRWVINYTKLDANWLQQRNVIEQDPFSGCKELFSQELSHLTGSPDRGGLYSISSRFFWLTAMGFKKLQDCFKIEVILGDGYAVMDDIRLKTLTRPSEFPVLFDRMHASNVPDYIGGYLANFTSALPLLKSHKQAYFTCCDLLHSPVWEGGMTRPELYELSLNSQIYTYTGAVLNEIEGAFAVSLSGKPMSPVEYHMFKRLETVPHLVKRDDLTSIATACFWRTVLPTSYKKLTNCVMQVREVVNVHSFFRALETWKNLGYPQHFLADLVERILENRLERSSPPHNAAPAPIAGRDKALISVCTTPFLVEFEVAATLWEPRLFPISSDAMISPSDIRRYSVKIPIRRIVLLSNLPPSHMVFSMVFGLPTDLDSNSMDVRSAIVRSSRAWKSSLQFVSTFDYDGQDSLCTVLLSERRMKAFIKQGFEVGLVNTAGWMIQSSKIPCSAMKAVGDVDNWDKSIEVPVVTGRTMTDAQVDSWSVRVMPMPGMMPGMPGMMGSDGAPGCPTQ
ncbi:hypothetical protein BDZ89DRAFT_1055943 [Hymenopellis radicata]|nr:hypothetical protein BDZ89DRAFT_1055943 [Hymenopellis radicata]